MKTGTRKINFLLEPCKRAYLRREATREANNRIIALNSEEIRVLEEKGERAEKNRTEYLRSWDVARLLNAYEEAEERTHDGCPRGFSCHQCNETYAEEYQLMDDIDDELWHRGMRRNAKEY